MATKTAKSANRFNIDILQWNYPFFTIEEVVVVEEEEEGDSCGDGTKEKSEATI